MERHLAAILAADVVGYSRLMGADEAKTLECLNAHLTQLIQPKITSHGGRVVKLMGDGILAEFTSVVEAVDCAIEIQQGMATRNTDVAHEDAMLLRIGINLGDVISQNDDIFGDGVNVAARLEGLALPGGICLSRAARDQVRDKISYALEDLGEIKVKNIARPVHAFRISTDEWAQSAPYAPRRDRTSGWRILAAGGIFLAILGTGIWWWQSMPHDEEGAETQIAATPAMPEVPSLAVLPFDNLSASPEEGFFVDGFTDDLITDLSKISGLFVIARNSAFTYQGRAVNVQQVAQELGVRYVLEGSLRRVGDKIRINAQLIDAVSGHHIWAERFDRGESDIFAMQDEVIKQITDALEVTLTAPEEARLARIPTANLKAYDLYLQAEAAFALSSEGLRDALDLYASAISEDPTFAEAHAGYARAALETWRGDYNNLLAGAVARKRAYDSAGRALELDNENARAFAVLSLIQLVDGRHDQAIASARQAVALQPNDSEPKVNLGLVFAFAGRAGEAVDAVTEALKHDPTPSASMLLSAGIVHVIAKNYETAIDLLLQVNEARPKTETALEFLACAYAQLGELNQAREQIEILRHSFPHVSLSYFAQIYDYYLRDEDRHRYLEGLRKAGLPEWPYGFEAPERDRVTEAELPALVIDRTWVGETANGGNFIQTVDAHGRLAYRSTNSVLTGQVQVHRDELCQLVDGYFVGRKLCGRIYRLPSSDAGDQYAYVYVGPDSVKYFSVAP